MTDVERARELLARVSTLHRSACRDLRAGATGDPVDSSRLQLYDLALSAAELAACRVAFDHVGDDADSLPSVERSIVVSPTIR
jgi:hypothetical protein